MRRESSPRVHRGHGAALVLVLLSLPLLSACPGTVDDVQCPSGRVCPAGQKCASNQDICIATDCGDGTVQAGEACDDGNIIDGDGCSRTCASAESCGNSIVDVAAGEACDDGNTRDLDGCSANCKSSELCGNGYVDRAVGETCDDANTIARDGCSVDCLSNELCGNGYVDRALGEACDDGNTTSGDGCSAECLSNEACGNGYLDTAAGELCDDGNNLPGDGCGPDCRPDDSCGDGVRDLGEACDDGNTTTETECAYGTLQCTACNATCSATLPLTGRYCGDGAKNDPSEVCDDGNTLNENACPYGQASCTTCNATCTGTLNLTGPYCGDGVRSDPEVCDDGNTLACGTCSATCSATQLAKAAGQITTVAASSLKQEESFTLNDGLNPSVVFAFDKGPGVPASRIRVSITTGATDTQVAEAIVTAIKGVGAELLISATSSGNIVTLTNDVEGTYGNRLITESVVDSGFRVTGMSGGAGYDCPEGTRCSVNEDCDPTLVCLSSKTCGIR